MSLSAEEFDLFRVEVRKFISQRIHPIEQAVDDNDRMNEAEWPKLVKEAIDLGIYAGNIPSEHGGGGLGLLHQSMLWEDFGLTTWPFTYLVGRPNPVLLNCTTEQKERYLYPVVRGEKTQSFSLTEPGSGSDAAAMRTTARKVEGGHVLNGTKHFISHGSDASFTIAFARTGDSKHDITAFLVDRETPGFKIGRRQRMMGWRGMEQNELVFEDCFLPDSQVLGAVGEGFTVAKSFLIQSRITMAALCTGMMERLIDLTVEYAKSRPVFGEPLSRKQGIQWMVADMVREHYAAQQTYRAAAMACDDAIAAGASHGDIVASQGHLVAIAKLQASQGLGRVADAAVQIHGGMGWSKDLPIERLYRDARIYRIVDGADQVLQGIIAQHLLKS
ncbi:MAG: acyl-CoA dehydrogenase family protein [Rhizobiaceae bacterium]